VEASRGDTERLALMLPALMCRCADYWSFGQLASFVGAPASFLRRASAITRRINLQYG